MNTSLDVSKFKMAPISEIDRGDYLVNLGPVLEKEDLITHYNIIIDRLNEKQVIKFQRDTVLVTI
jgi:predicted transcriptional regulator of viral defense system